MAWAFRVCPRVARQVSLLPLHVVMLFYLGMLSATIFSGLFLSGEFGRLGGPPLRRGRTSGRPLWWLNVLLLDPDTGLPSNSVWDLTRHAP